MSIIDIERIAAVARDSGVCVQTEQLRSLRRQQEIEALDRRLMGRVPHPPSVQESALSSDAVQTESVDEAEERLRSAL